MDVQLAFGKSRDQGIRVGHLASFSWAPRATFLSNEKWSFAGMLLKSVRIVRSSANRERLLSGKPSLSLAFGGPTTGIVAASITHADGAAVNETAADDGRLAEMQWRI